MDAPGTPSSPTSPGATIRALQPGAFQQPPNAPLRRPKNWRSSSRAWTHRGLAREREAFFDTRVTGRAECWAAVRLATEMSRNEGDLKGAQAVLDAAGLTVPTGRLSDGVWDDRGVLYKLPRWVVSDPLNVVEGSDDGVGDGGEIEDADADEDEVKDDGSDDDEDGTKADEKGKGKIVPAADLMRLRTRPSDRGCDVIVTVEKTSTVRTIARKVIEEAKVSIAGSVIIKLADERFSWQIASGTKVRIAYMGKLLKDGESLSSQGWQPGHVLNIFVF
ncbi:MAG: hypothetical protein M1828_004478 [Chrysothrix sp. TS-e1954]|nr:MAG: hypothetical protein M1828_004478 [Chrysothrix sp. TS-e1954]